MPKPTPQEVAEMPQYFGLYFDPETGMTYTGDGTQTGYTFERATWTGPFGLHFNWPWLNPISFATKETGVKVLRFARGVAPQSLAVSLDETSKTVGPFTRTIERSIVVSNGDTEENFSAGWLASSIIRHGETMARKLWLAELKQAGLV
jgi:hypothetical protein